MTETPDILVVDDDRMLNRVICDFVRFEGYTVRSALDGSSALQQVASQLPTLVLLDLMLPDTDGFNVCETLKQNNHTRDVPVIMLTALTDAASRQRGLQCGAADYVTKPFDPDALMATVKRYITH